jgi:hypothetical protein
VGVRSICKSLRRSSAVQAWGKQLLLVFLLCLAGSPTVGEIESKRPDQDTFIRRAIFAGNSVWLLSDAGSLFAVKEDGSSTAIATSQPVGDIWRQNGGVFAVSCATSDCSRWAIARWNSGKFVTETTVSTGGDELIAAGGSDVSTFILTRRRIVEIHDGKIHETKIATAKDALNSVATTLFTERGIYLGLNAGEWGGGLKFIDAATGHIKVIERNATKTLCGGPLNTQCDPVTGLAVEPWKPDCIVASIGLVHMMPHGRLVEVCGGIVKRIYFKPFGEQPPHGGLDDGEPSSTVAFFGLNADGQSLWAVGIDGIYQIDRNGAHSRPLPGFHNIGAFRVNFSDPRMVLVLTDINQRRSVSGAVPLLVPR